MIEDELAQNMDLDELESLSINEEIVEKRRIRPLASFLEFDLSNRPSLAKDRISKKRVYFGIFIGFMLIVLGVMPEIFTSNHFISSQFEKTAVPNELSAFSASFFFIALGMLVIITRLILLTYGRDFFIGQKFASVVVKKPFEKGVRLADSLNEYLGVRYRTRNVNVFGMTSFIQHIIDLQHPNETKSIPLYVSRNAENIFKKWEEFARHFQMPALFNTVEGVLEIPPSHLDKNQALLIKENKKEISHDCLYKVPNSFKIVETSKMCQIDPQIRDSALSTFSLIILSFFLFFLLFLGLAMSQALNLIFILYFGVGLFVISFICLYFRKKRIVISKQGLRVKSRFIFFSSFGKLIKPEELRYLHVIQNSYLLKNILVIGAEEKTIHIGTGLPKEDLLWLENFINAQIERFHV